MVVLMDSSEVDYYTPFNDSFLSHDLYHLHNLSGIDYLLQYMTNRAVSDEVFAALVTTYSALILTGAVGNGLVCLVVARKPQMRTARNVFVINLAISDLLLCLFTMPFTLSELLLKAWPLGEFMCKMVSALQATSIFVSTMSITAIALDRYNVILYPTQEWTKRLGAVAALSAVWTLAFLMALPLFVFRRLDKHFVGLPQLEYVYFCYEKWPVEHGRAYYSIASIVFQYVLPIAILSLAYTRICRRLHNRMSARGRCQTRDSDQQRMRRTNLLLVSIALIFIVSWLPLNCLNLITDWYYSFPSEGSAFRIVFASCHVVGMSSACSNPLLYGWLNDNFRKEFKEVFTGCYGCVVRVLSPILPADDGSPVPVMVYTRENSKRSHRANNGMEDTVLDTKVTIAED